MGKIIMFYLSAGRKYRHRAVKAAIWLLGRVLEAESDEMWRHTDMIDEIDRHCLVVSCADYERLEMDCLISEHAVDYLESAIDDLGFTY